MTLAEFDSLILGYHKCTVPGRCVFCDSLNREVVGPYRYVPFDVPGYYDPGDIPNVTIIKLDEEEGA